MTLREPARHRDPLTLEEFEAQRSPYGLFRSYCRARRRHWLLRQVLPVLICILLWHEMPLASAILAPLAIFLTDCLDVWYLNRQVRGHPRPERLPVIQGIATFSAAAHGLSVAVGTGTLLSLGADMRFISVVICIGMIFDSSLQFALNMSASLARVIFQAIMLAGIFLLAWANVGTGGDTGLSADSFAALLMLIFGISFIGTVQHQRVRSHAMQRATLQQSEALANLNRTLTEARQKTRRLGHVVEETQDSVVVTDKSGRLTWSNSAFSELLGIGARTAQGCHVAQLLDLGPRDCAHLDSAIAQRRAVRLDVQRKIKGAQATWLDVSLSPMRGQGPSQDAFVAVIRDISEHKRREAALAEATKAAEAGAQAKTTFLATMSHEIRTPMNGVIATSDLLLDTPLNPEQRTLVETISSSGEALLTIINDVLDYTKLDAGKLETAQQPFQPVPLLRSVLDLVTPLAEAKALTITLGLPASLPDTLLGDEARIRQVLLNLLGNAIKFTEHGGIRLEVRATPEADRCALDIVVVDSGIGIAPARQADIFRTFTQADATITRRFGGTGLGLTISRSLAQAMGGDIRLTSRPGEGSRFTLSLDLPIAEPAAQEAPPRAAAPDAGGTGGRPAEQSLLGMSILVAEDNRTNRMLLGKMLADTGAQMRFAENGADALRLFVDMRPSLILMDMSMPVMDGLEATRRIRAAEEINGMAPCTILALTANAFEEDRRRCLEAGMDGHLTKPVRKAGLLEVLIQLHESPLQGAPSPEAEAPAPARAVIDPPMPGFASR